MDQILSTEQKDLFKSLVANPRQVDTGHQEQLELLVKAYPQSCILRALLASASQTNQADVFQQNIKAASVYAPDRGVLYNLINYPEKLVQTGPYKQANVPAIIEGTIDTDARAGGLNYIDNADPAQPLSGNGAPGKQSTDIQDLEFELVGQSWGNVSDSQYAHDPESDSNLEELIFAQYGWISDGTGNDAAETSQDSAAGTENPYKANPPEGDIKKKI